MTESDAVIKEMENDIILKVKMIEENILTGKGSKDPLVKIEMLAMITDELSDVLLNWDERLIDSGLGDEFA
jgi:esterase/lipase